MQRLACMTAQDTDRKLHFKDSNIALHMPSGPPPQYFLIRSVIKTSFNSQSDKLTA